MSVSNETLIAPVLSRIATEIGSWSFTLKLGLTLIVIIMALAAFAPWVAPYDPDLQDYDAILVPPNLSYLFGTDNLGRDIFSRVLYGARLDLSAGFVMTFVPMIYGVLIGAYSGYRGGWFDTVVGSVTNMAIAFPFLVMIIVVVAVIGPGIKAIFISVFLLAWTMYARLARAEMLVERAKDYMLAAKVLGFPFTRRGGRCRMFRVCRVRCTRPLGMVRRRCRGVLRPRMVVARSLGMRFRCLLVLRVCV